MPIEQLKFINNLYKLSAQMNLRGPNASARELYLILILQTAMLLNTEMNKDVVIPYAGTRTTGLHESFKGIILVYWSEQNA